MNSRSYHYLLLLLSFWLVAGSAQAQHLDVLLQVVDGQIVTGAADYDSNTWLVGQRVFQRQFLSNFRTNDPGFTALESGNSLLEAGVSGFPPRREIFLDIVPSTIDNVRANFWYWDGIDAEEDGLTTEDVSFGLAPAGVTWNLIDEDFTLLTADGTDTVVSDAFLQRSFSTDGGVHNHLLMQVANSGDGPPPEGIYLAALTVHAEGFEDSMPFFFVHRTDGLTDDPRDIAATWVDDNYDQLIREPVTGDYDSSGVVDGADFLVWQRRLLSEAIPVGSGADGDQSGLVDAADLDVWENYFGAGTLLAGGAAAPVPEPGTLLLAIIASVGLAARRRRRC